MIQNKHLFFYCLCDSAIVVRLKAALISSSEYPCSFSISLNRSISTVFSFAIPSKKTIDPFFVCKNQSIVFQNLSNSEGTTQLTSIGSLSSFISFASAKQINGIRLPENNLWQLPLRLVNTFPIPKELRNDQLFQGFSHHPVFLPS